MISYWERSSLLHYDIIIVGAGIVGLNTAINLRELYPHKRIAIFERGILPTGASTRNAGFACFGSVSELIDDQAHATEAEIYSLFQKRKNGIHLLRQRIGDHRLQYKAEGSHELLTEAELPLLDHIAYFNTLLKDLDERPIFSHAHHIISDYGFSPSHFHTAIAAHTEGSIDTGSMMRHLHQLALEKNIVIMTGMQVTHFEAAPTHCLLHVLDPIHHTDIAFRCDQVAFCTNAFSKHFFPELDITPGRGQVLITHPIPQLRPKGIFHFDKGYYYFRVIHDRILFGGGRNLDFSGENTSDIALNPAILATLTQYLQEAIVPDLDISIDMQWAGIMAFGATKLPILHRHSDRVFGAFRLGGMGVALGAQLAIDLATAMHQS